MAQLVKPVALLGLALGLSGSVSISQATGPDRLLHDIPPSFRDETVQDWCVLLINGTVIPDAPTAYLWPVREEAVGWYECPPPPPASASDDEQIPCVAPESPSKKQRQNKAKGVQVMDAWWPYPPPPKSPRRATWHMFSLWPQNHVFVFPRWQTHQPVTLASITEEGLQLEEERRLRRPWLSLGEEWESWQLPRPSPAPTVFGAAEEDEAGEQGEQKGEEDLVFGLPYSEDENGNEERPSKVKRDAWSQRPEEEYVPTVVDRWGTGDEHGEGVNVGDATETATADSNSPAEDSLMEKHQHEHYYHHHEEGEDTSDGDRAEDPRGGQG